MLSRPCEVSGVRFSPEEWQALLRVRVGVPLQTAQPTCELCGSEDDRWGDHRLCCAKRGLYRRHNRVRDLLARGAQRWAWGSRTTRALRRRP